MSDFDSRWRELSPVFVLGMQRSGTSVLAQALLRMGFQGFAEGHLWLDLVRPFEALLDPTDRPQLRHDDYTLGADRADVLLRYVAVAIDQFHRDHLPAGFSRWMDKSPGAYAVRNAPLLALMFPRSQFVFISRNGITTVHSGKHRWPDNPRIFEGMCNGWVETMSTWRHVRSSLLGRYLEIAQETLACHPNETARRLTAFVGAPMHHRSIAQFLESQRVLSSFPQKPPGDYRYEINWTEDEKRTFIDTCASEMSAWGYVLDFEPPTRA